MPLNYEHLMTRRFEPVTHAYDARDTILYALGIGAGIGAADETLPFVYEADLRAFPTMAVALAQEPFWIMDPATGITWQQVLHGEQRLTVHKPLAAAGTVIGQAAIEAVYDKGAAKGAIVLVRREIRDARSGDPLVTLRSSVFLRADGGFGGTAEGTPKPHAVPTDQPPAFVLDLPTRPEQALIYRLSGDWNPLHADPAVARQAGFDRPILHGLCSYGVAGRALVKLLCGNAPDRLTRLDVRFSSPVFPGETIRTEVWPEGAGRAAFRCRVVERDIVCLSNGCVEYRT